MNTAFTPFKTAGMYGVFNLLSVNPNIPAPDALQAASDLLSTIVEPIDDAAMGNKPLANNEAWLVAHTLETAKALVDAVFEGYAEPKGSDCAELITAIGNIKLYELSESDLRGINRAQGMLQTRIMDELKSRKERGV